jgi:diguanylate cyclase (GGDEF)-like protein
MVARLTSLREVLTARDVDAVADPVVVHRAVDRVTAAAAEEVLRRSERASRTDPLTGAGNRRAFDEAMRSAVSAAARQGHEVTLAVIDLDGLKAINDTEGHGAGDDALVRLVGALRGAVRHEDAVFRVGGDEFVVLLPFTSVPAAGALLERVARTGAPAFTWGAAGFPRHGSDAASVVAAADRDLYRRRRAGRGRPSAVGATARVTPWRRAWPASIAAALAVGAVVAVAVLGAWAPRAHPVSALPQGRPPVAPASPGRAGSAVAPAPPSGQPTDALTAVGGAAPAHAVVTGASGPPRTGQGPVGAPAGSATGAAGSGAGTTTAPAPSLPPATPAPPGAPGGSTAVPTDPPGSAGGVVGAVQALVAAVPVPGANSVGTVLAQVLTGAPAPAVTAGAPTLPSALLPAGGGI